MSCTAEDECRITDAVRKEIVKLINGSDLALDDLVEYVYASLTSSFLPGDKVQLMAKHHGQAADGEVIGKTRCSLKVEDNTPVKRSECTSAASTPSKQPFLTYDVKTDSGVIYSVPPNDLVRCTPIPGKADVRCFLEESAKFDLQHWSISHKILASPAKVENGKVYASKRKLILNYVHKLTPQKKTKNEINEQHDKALVMELSSLMRKPEILLSKIDIPASPVQAFSEDVMKLSPQKISKNEQTDKQQAKASVMETSSSMRKPEILLSRIDSSTSSSQSFSDCVTKPSPQKKTEIETTNEHQKKALVMEISTSMRKPEILLSRIDGPVDCGTKSSLQLKQHDETSEQKNGLCVAKTFGPMLEAEVLLTRVDRAAAASAAVQPVIGKKLKQVTMVEMMNKIVSMNGNSITKSLPKDDNNNNDSNKDNTTTTTTTTSTSTENRSSEPEASILNSNDENPIAKPRLIRKRKIITAQWAITHATPMPVPKQIAIPSGTPVSIVGDCFFIAEFIGCHSEFLRHGSDTIFFPPTAAHLLQVLTLGSQGFIYLNNVLICLLRILLQEKKSQRKQIMKMDVSNFTATIYSASELTRRFLEEAISTEQEAVSQALIALRTQDLCELNVVQKANILIAMCHLLLDTNVCTTYRDKKIEEARYARQQILNMNIKEKAEKLDKENFEGDGATIVSSVTTDGGSVKGFYGGENVDNRIEPEKENSISVAQTKREQAIKASKEKQLRDKLQRAKQLADEKQAKLLKKFQKSVDVGKSLIRIDPIGIDRYGCRYWKLMHSGYGLVLEYTVPANEIRPTESGSNDSEKPPMTFWYQFDTEDQIDALNKCLCTRFLPERILAANLQKNAEDIQFCISHPTTNLEPSDGILNLVETLREEIVTLEENLFYGSLALVTDRDQWMKQLTDAQTSTDFAASLLQLYCDMPLHILSGSIWSVKTGDVPTSAAAAVKDDFLEQLKGDLSLSRLHLLLTILSNCIQWDLETDPSKCRVCHTVTKKFLVVCVSCGSSVHADCISPPLTKLPRHVKWLCSPCKKNNRAEMPDIHLSSNDKLLKDIAFQKPMCCKSRNRNSDDLVVCKKCRKVYHKKCHRPPLRNTPRRDWECSTCVRRKKH